MPKYYHTDWQPQFGAPILPPQATAKPKKQRRRGSWKRPSDAMIQRERDKCRITRINPETGEVMAVLEPATKQRTMLYGKTGKAPKKPHQR